MKHLTWIMLTVLAQCATAQSLLLRFDTSEHADLELIDLLQEERVFLRLQDFVDANFILQDELSYVFYPGRELFFDAAHNQANIPFSLLHDLQHDLKVKFPEQPNVRRRIFASASEHLLWTFLGRALVNQYALPIVGQEAFVLDSFATLMLLNHNGGREDDYLLDAAEAYLLVVRSSSLLSSDSSKNEQQLDQQRYQEIVCLVLGKDHGVNDTILQELAWDEARLEACRQSYHQLIQKWYQELSPFLKAGNRIQSWLPKLIP